MNCSVVPAARTFPGKGHPPKVLYIITVGSRPWRTGWETCWSGEGPRALFRCTMLHRMEQHGDFRRQGSGRIAVDPGQVLCVSARRGECPRPSPSLGQQGSWALHGQNGQEGSCKKKGHPSWCHATQQVWGERRQRAWEPKGSSCGRRQFAEGSGVSGGAKATGKGDKHCSAVGLRRGRLT